MKQKLNILLTRDRSAFSTKWVCNFATNLYLAGHNVTLLCDSYENKQPAPIDSGVCKINLSERSKNPLINLWNKMHRHISIPTFRFKKAIKQINPDIIICYFLRDLLNVTLFQNHNIPIILMMHNPPDEVFAKQFKHWWNRKLLHYLVDKNVNAIQVLMPEFVAPVKAEFPQKDVFVIPNQVPMPEQQKDYSVDTHTIIHIAQIAEAKHQKDLIEAFLPLAKEFPNWKIKFFGRVKNSKRHKEYMQSLKKIVIDNHLEKQILFPGFSHNITEEYLNSEIVALPSHTEGFGYGLADGLALGLPGIGYSFACAINSIIINGKSGWLVDDSKEFTNKLRLLMKDSAKRAEMGKFARKDMSRYSPQIVIASWLKLIYHVYGEKSE